MARRSNKTAEPEILPAGPDQPRTKTVNAKHKIEYEAPVVVPDDGPAEDEGFTIEENGPEETERRRRRKTAKDERDELRREMDKIGVAPLSRLRLTIEKYKHGDSLDSGVTADKIYCTKYSVNRDHVLNDDFLDVARQYGPGRYWLTLRLDNKVVRQWDREITMPQNGQAGRINPDDPTSPNINIHMPENGAAPIPQDPFKEAERAFSLFKKYGEAFGFQPNGNAAPQKTEDEILATALLKQPDMVENVVGSLVKRFGKSGNGEDDPSPWAVAMKLVESGQASTIVKTVIDSFFNGFRGMIPNNGGPQHAAHAPAQGVAPQQQTNQAPMQGLPPSSPRSEVQAPQEQPGEQPRQVSPEQQALGLVINHCQRRLPPRMTFNALTQMEQRLDFMLNQHAMQTGEIVENAITSYLDLFASMPADDVLNFVKTLPNGEALAALPHAKQWIEELQKLIKDSESEDEAE